MAVVTLAMMMTIMNGKMVTIEKYDDDDDDACGVIRILIMADDGWMHSPSDFDTCGT